MILSSEVIGSISGQSALATLIQQYRGVARTLFSVRSLGLSHSKVPIYTPTTAICTHNHPHSVCAVVPCYIGPLLHVEGQRTRLIAVL